jgi:hypothetical protein
MPKFPPQVLRLFRKLLIVLCLGGLWTCISLFSAAILATSAVSPTEAGSIVEHLRTLDHSDALWVLIIPFSFFLVIMTRANRNR